MTGAGRTKQTSIERARDKRTSGPGHALLSLTTDPFIRYDSYCNERSSHNSTHSIQPLCGGQRACGLTVLRQCPQRGVLSFWNGRQTARDVCADDLAGNVLPEVDDPESRDAASGARNPCGRRQSDSVRMLAHSFQGPEKTDSRATATRSSQRGRIRRGANPNPRVEPPVCQGAEQSRPRLRTIQLDVGKVAA